MTPRGVLIWLAVLAGLGLPLGVAATSPLLAYRDTVYILAGLAGVAGLALLLVQPLLAGGYLPGLSARLGRRVHRVTGALLVLAVLLHVAGLWVTSPPDAIDTLLFRSPAPFAPFGVVALWALLAAAGLALVRDRLGARRFRVGHGALVLVAVLASVGHALLIAGTMGTATKVALCLLVTAMTLKVLADLRVWRLIRRGA